MKKLLDKVMDFESFSAEEAESFILALNNDKVQPEIASAILIGLNMKGIQLDELVGFRNALLELSIKPDIDASDAIDLCGTGGDGKNTFNISTTTSLVLASMGYRVIKHGNYGVSSLCGSSNVLEELGFNFTTDSKILNQNLEQKKICFLHAPLFHPAMKKIAPIRKALGVRTIFNCLGPLVNPVQPAYQLTGTFSKELATIYPHIIKDFRKDFKVIYGMDGFDEVTLTDNSISNGKYENSIINAATFGHSNLQQTELFGGSSIPAAAAIIRNILAGRGTDAQNNVIAANVALAIQLFEPTSCLIDNRTNALEHIQSGVSQQILN